MLRRKFLTGAAVGGAASAVAASFPAPAIAQAMPEIKWRMPSSFPKSLDTIYGGSEYVAKRVAQITDNKFQIRSFAGGEIVPGLQVLDAVQNGTVELGHTANYYYVGKDPCFAFDTAIPFGLNPRQQYSWMQHGGGRELMNEFFKGYNCMPILAGNTGTQMGGWFRKEIKTVKDLEGLKFRIGGFAGQIMAKLGAVPQQIAGGDIYPALEKGTIDAAEWIGPYDDEKLGFNKVAKYYYYPGWWEGGPSLSVDVNLAKWAELPESYKAALETACGEAYIWMLSKYDAVNPPALKRLVAGGAILRAFPKEIMDASYKAANEVYAETTAKNPMFKKLYDSMAKFREEQNQYIQVTDNYFDNFMIQKAAAERRAAAPAKAPAKK